jgi:hypothetical protein
MQVVSQPTLLERAITVDTTVRTDVEAPEARYLIMGLGQFQQLGGLTLRDAAWVMLAQRQKMPEG